MLKNVFSNWLGLILRGVVSVVLTPILIHQLGDFQYGLWILVMSVVDYSGILDMGIRPTLHRFVARWKGLNDRAALNETIGSAFALSCGAGLLVLLVTFAALPWISSFFDIRGANPSEFRWLICLLGINLAILLPARVLGAYLCGVQRFDLFNVVEVVTCLSRGILIVLILHLGKGLMGVAVVTLGTSLALLALNYALVVHVDPEVSVDPRQLNWVRVRELGAYSFYLFLNTAGDYLRFYTDSLVIAWVISISLVTPFAVAGRLMEYFKSVVFGLVGPLVPRMSELEGLGKWQELQQIFLRGTRAAALLSLLIGSVFLLDGRVILRLWVGERFVGSYPLLMALAAGYVVTLAQYPSNVLICALNRHQALGWWTLAEGVINLFLSVHWAKTYGLVGVAMGTTVPMVFTALLLQPWYVLRLVKLPAWQYVREGLLRPLCAGGVFLVACHFALTPPPTASRADFVLTLAAQCGLFAVLAYTLGLWTGERELVAMNLSHFPRLALRRLRRAQRSGALAG
jgi:O-antigen/teichoic acid export membrane protein